MPKHCTNWAKATKTEKALPRTDDKPLCGLNARQGNADAELQLGKAYLKGKGVTADTKKAKSWLTKAIANPKGGDKILSKLRREASEGDENAKAILGIVGK